MIPEKILFQITTQNKLGKWYHLNFVHIDAMIAVLSHKMPYSNINISRDFYIDNSYCTCTYMISFELFQYS